MTVVTVDLRAGSVLAGYAVTIVTSPATEVTLQQIKTATSNLTSSYQLAFDEGYTVVNGDLNTHSQLNCKSYQESFRSKVFCVF